MAESRLESNKQTNKVRDVAREEWVALWHDVQPCVCVDAIPGAEERACAEVDLRGANPLHDSSTGTEQDGLKNEWLNKMRWYQPVCEKVEEHMAAHDYEQQRRCPRVRVPFVGHRLWRSRWRHAEAIASCLVCSQILDCVRLWIGDLRMEHRKALVPVHLVHNLEQSLLHRQRLLLLLADVVLVPFFRKGLRIADWAANASKPRHKSKTWPRATSDAGAHLGVSRLGFRELL